MQEFGIKKEKNSETLVEHKTSKTEQTLVKTELNKKKKKKG